MKILIEIASLHVLFYLIYRIWLQKETDHSRKRYFLLLTTLLSIGIPFVELPSPEVVQIYQADLPTLSFAQNAPQETSLFTIEQLLTGGLIAVSSILIIFIISSVIKVVRLYRNASPTQYREHSIRIHPAIDQSFSFFNWIFSRELNPSVIAHELAHVKLRHSYDILLFQLFRAVFWWLPTSWLVLREAKIIHEYQADAVALKDNNIDEYQQLLISSTLSSMGWGLASSFHDGVLLKRLKAMKLQTKKISNWKISSLGVLVAIIVLTFACEELDQDIKKMSEDSRQISFDELPADMQAKFREKSDDFTYMIIYVNQAEGTSIKEILSQLDDIDPALIESLDVRKNENGDEIFLVLRKTATTFEYVEQKSKVSEDVFTMVDHQPEYPGGMPAFYEFIKTNLNYPEQASKLGVEGRVYVQFIVNTDGSLSDIKAVKGIGGGCDKEAERVLALAPKFNPGSNNGKPVRVRMVLPIIFKLSDSDTSDKTIELIEYQSDGKE